jgi:hypothetical protein
MMTRDDIRWPAPGANRSPSPKTPPVPRPKPAPPDHAHAAEFERDLQAAVDAGKVLKMTADVTLHSAVRIVIRHSHRGWFGLDGNHFKIHSHVQGHPALTFVMEESLSNVCARGFYVGDLTMLGSGDEDCGLVIDAAAQQSWLVDCHLENLWLESFGGKAALRCRGNVFESSWYDISTQDNKGSGLAFENAGGHAVCSAMRLFGGTQRQNGDYGTLIDQYDGPGDLRFHGQYYCLNAKGGINSWAGCELVVDCGFENNGEFGIYIQNYATLIRCTGSTMGTQPQLVIGYLANPWAITDCSMVGYSGADPMFGSFSGNGQRLTLRGKYDPAKLTIGSGVDVVFTP